MKIVRHADKGKAPFGDMLTTDGIEKSRQLGATAFRGQNFTHLAGTGHTRTFQTLMAIVEGAGDVAVGAIGQIDLFPTDTNHPEYIELTGMVKAADGKMDAKSWIDANREWYDRWTAGLLVKQIAFLRDVKTAKVLAVSHQAILEGIVYAATGAVLPMPPTLGWVHLQQRDDAGWWKLLHVSYDK